MFKIKLKWQKLEKIKNFFKRLPRILGENTFLTSLALFVLAIIFGGLLFYKYIILVEQRKPELTEKLLYFDEKSFQKILQIWQERKIKFDQADTKQYPDPFKIER